MDTETFRSTMASAFGAAPPATQVPRPPTRVSRLPPRLHSVPSRVSKQSPRTQTQKNDYSLNLAQFENNVDTPAPLRPLRRKQGSDDLEHDFFSPQPLPDPQPASTFTNQAQHQPHHDAPLIDIGDEEHAQTSVPTLQIPQAFHHYRPSMHQNPPQFPPRITSTRPAKRLKTVAPACYSCQALQIQVQDLKNDINVYQTTQERYKTALRSEREAHHADKQARRMAENENERLKDALADLKDALELSRGRFARVKRACQEEEEAVEVEAEQEARRVAEVVPSSDNEESLSLD